MKRKKTSRTYRVIKWLIWLFFPKMKVEGTEHLPEEPAIIVANHCQLNGPIACELYFPGKRYTWCAGGIMSRETAADYMFSDFWSYKPRYTHWFYKLLARVTAPLFVCINTNAETIAVYRDTRIISTFKATVSRLQEGAHVVVFPEHNQTCNNIIYDFENRFIDIAKLYYKKTGRELSFVPMYITPKLKKMCLGEPICFRADAPIEQERVRICRYLMEQVTQIGRSLPAHTVVPYRNIRRRDYPSNLAAEVEKHEKTGC